MDDIEKEQLVAMVDGLSDKVGEFIRYWGFKKIHGKIWCHLFLSNEALDATQLIERMGVSKALMSQSLAELLEYKVILIIEEDENKKRKRYATNEKILSVITSVLRQREQMILCTILSHYRAVKSAACTDLEVIGVDKKKLEKLGAMINFAEKFLGSMLRFESISFKAFKKVFE